jgi:hypothetical protein
MRSKTFRRKNGKMSRRRRGGVGDGMLTRQTSGELIAMEEGRPAERPMLGRTTTGELSRMEEGFAPTAPQMDYEREMVEPSAPPIEMMYEMENQERARNQEADRQRLFRSNTQDLDDMESGDIDIESGVTRKERGGRKKRTRKGRKGRKTRKGRKKSHRR